VDNPDISPNGYNLAPVPARVDRRKLKKSFLQIIVFIYFSHFCAKNIIFPQKTACGF